MLMRGAEHRSVGPLVGRRQDARAAAVALNLDEHYRASRPVLRAARTSVVVVSATSAA
jgi:hypothetical protein